MMKSAMAAETLAFATGFDAGFLIRRQVDLMPCRPVPLLMLMDIRCLFDGLASNETTKEGRLMLEVVPARQSYSHGEIGYVGLVKSNDKLADDRTKSSGNGALIYAMSSRRFSHSVRDYIN